MESMNIGDNDLNCYISKIDYEKLVSQGNKEDIDRLLHYAMIKFKEKNVRKGTIKVLDEYATAINEDIKEEIKKKLKKEQVNVFSRRGQLEQFLEEQPFFYDEAKSFWLWDKENYCWKKSDEINCLNLIRNILGAETIESKARNELIAGFQQVGRENMPKPPKKSWVQFKEKIYDIITGEVFEASPEYFITNPIPHNIGKSEETPNIDKLFVEWVGEEHKQELYELAAYSICPDRFMQRIYALCGGGSNGKGTFMKIVKKLIGENNYVSTELKQLSENQFETATIYRKLLAIMGEVSVDDLKNTNMIKEISGEDSIRFCFKGKLPFTEENTCLGVCLTNSLPTTPDKSLGFYRRWMIIDFTNQFELISKDLISEITEEEFENLCFKSIQTLKELYKTRKFTNEGTFQEREEKYEERSNPLERFIEEFCYDEPEEKITLREFTNYYNAWLKSNHLRSYTPIMVGKLIRNMGYIVGHRKELGISNVYILGFSFKKDKIKEYIQEKLLELPELLKVQVNPTWETTEDFSSLSSSSNRPSNFNKLQKLKWLKETINKEINDKNLDLISTEEVIELVKNKLPEDNIEDLLDKLNQNGELLQQGRKWKVI